MKPTERSAYSAIVDRPPLRLPQGVRLVAWPILNVEVWEIERPMPRQALVAPTGAVLLPDVANWSWHEYGMRVGFWRLKAVLDRFGIRPTLSINGRVPEAYPRVAAAARDGGWEFMGHNYVQVPMHKVENEREAIHRCLDALEKYTGKRPVGWLGPGLTETYDTPDLLAEAGVKYIGDWAYDDEPTEIATKHGPLVTLPYPIEINDIPVLAIQHHPSELFVRKACDAFDRLYLESAERAKFFSIAFHPYLSGTPHQIKYFETVIEYVSRFPGVAFWTGEQILEWYRSARPAGKK
ncbi:MAG TPA: polysaccharide deacetylase family protein [Myxococcaceae bacterium]|nr:polysaccharide deacetylase family protein [Myxococcaceae bacterium]